MWFTLFKNNGCSEKKVDNARWYSEFHIWKWIWVIWISQTSESSSEYSATSEESEEEFEIENTVSVNL